MSMAEKKNDTSEYAHQRIDHLEPRVKKVEEWQQDKDIRIRTGITYLKALVFLSAAQTMGLVELLKKMFL